MSGKVAIDTRRRGAEKAKQRLKGFLCVSAPLREYFAVNLKDH